MTDFSIGQKVVCVNDSPEGMTIYAEDPFRLMKGNIYTVVDKFAFNSSYWGPFVGIQLAEQAPIKGKRGTWHPSRFRPLEEKPDAIELFRTIGNQPVIPDNAPTQEPLRKKERVKQDWRTA